MNPLQVTFSTLTPIWTGGVDRKVDRLHATGLMGSLRWWFEALLRGWNLPACDPTTHRCPDSKGRYCGACFVYGTTGWRRAFGIRVMEEAREQDVPSEKLFLPSGRKRQQGGEVRKGGWYLNPGWMGRFRLEFVPLHADRYVREAVMLPLRILEQWGGFGAKTQLGYGVIQGCETRWWEPQDGLESGINRLRNYFDNELIDRSAAHLDTRTHPAVCDGDGTCKAVYPDLRDFFFAQYSFTATFPWWQHLYTYRKTSQDDRSQMDTMGERGLVPVTPEIRNQWRYYGGLAGITQASQACVFGYVNREQRARSRLHVSWAVRQGDSDTWHIHIWGWLPRDWEARESILAAIHQMDSLRALLGIRPEHDRQGVLEHDRQGVLEQVKVKLEAWREFRSPDRDLGASADEDYVQYLLRLLKGR